MNNPPALTHPVQTCVAVFKLFSQRCPYGSMSATSVFPSASWAAAGTEAGAKVPPGTSESTVVAKGSR